VNLHQHLRLCRLPLALTTTADIVTGAVASRAAGFEGALPAGQPLQLSLLLVAGLAFYTGGMTLNDVFDATRDSTLYPSRPIPSGAVSSRAAALQGIALLFLGLILSFGVGARTGLIGLLLTLWIVLYNSLLKRWAVPGALAMGVCRYLDLQLGAGFSGGALFLPAVVLGLYTAGLTYLSTLEDTPTRAGALKAGLLFVVAVLMFGGALYPRYLLSVWYFAVVVGAAAMVGMRAVHTGTRSDVARLTLLLLLGMFFVNAGSLTGYGAWKHGAVVAGLAGSFPLIRWLLTRHAVTP
jgi:4-hydroxybenzoate polyprenyltransferase